MIAVKIEALKNVAVKDVGEETLDVTWEIPGSLKNYNVSIVHRIRWEHQWKDELHFAGVREPLLWSKSDATGSGSS